MHCVAKALPFSVIPSCAGNGSDRRPEIEGPKHTKLVHQKWYFYENSYNRHCACTVTKSHVASHHTTLLTLPDQTVWERWRNSPFLIGRGVFHQESFETDLTIYLVDIHHVTNSSWLFYFLEFLADAC